MPSEIAGNKIHALERHVLRALCSGDIPPEIRAQSFEDLKSHRWSDPEHRVVFEALLRTPRSEEESLRERLPAQATRMGFPDVDWELYFTRNHELGAGVAARVHELVNLAALPK